MAKSYNDVIEEIGKPITFKSMYGSRYTYNPDYSYSVKRESVRKSIDSYKGYTISDCVVSVRVPLSENPDGFIDIKVNKYTFLNTNISVYEVPYSRDDGGDMDFMINFNLHPLSAYIGKKRYFVENGSYVQCKTIKDMKTLDYTHRNDKAWAWSKVAVSATSDIITVATFGVATAEAQSAKGVLIAALKGLAPNSPKL